MNRWPLLGFVSNFENNFATRVASRDLFLGFHRFGQRERLRDDYLDFLLVDQPANFGELIRIRLHTERRASNLVFIQLRLIDLGDERNVKAPFFHHAVGRGQGILTD